MSLKITAQAEGFFQQYELLDGLSQLGSDPACQACVQHPEMPPVALQIEVTGASVVIRNRCGYPIFIGDEELDTESRSAWKPGATCAVTASVTLELDRASVEAGSEPGDTPEESYFSTGRITQIAVITLCAVIGIQQSMVDPAAEVSAPSFGYPELRDELQNASRIAAENDDAYGRVQWDDALRLLQEARFFELRFAKSEQRQVLLAYQRLLESQVLERAKNAESDSTERRLYRYATAKKASIEL